MPAPSPGPRTEGPSGRRNRMTFGLTARDNAARVGCTAQAGAEAARAA